MELEKDYFEPEKGHQTQHFAKSMINLGKRSASATTENLSPSKTNKLSDSIDGNEVSDSQIMCKGCKKLCKSLIKHLKMSKTDCKKFYDIEKLTQERKAIADANKKLKNAEYKKNREIKT